MPFFILQGKILGFISPISLLVVSFKSIPVSLQNFYTDQSNGKFSFILFDSEVVLDKDDHSFLHWAFRIYTFIVFYPVPNLYLFSYPLLLLPSPSSKPWSTSTPLIHSLGSLQL